MHIGELAKAAGLSVDAVRFYERRGLLGKPQRTAGGFRVYEPAASESLHFVRTSQQLGFSLAEIRELLQLRQAGGHACREVHEKLAAKLKIVREKIRELAALERQLRASLAQCKRQLRSGARPAGACPMLSRSCRRSTS